MPPAIVDAVGKAHPPAGPDARIVSLVPSITELLFALDLGAHVVGRTHYCIHPHDQVARLPSVGGTKKIALGRLLRLAPTHVIVNVDETPKALAEAIVAAGPTVVVTHPLGPEDNPALYRLIGDLFDRHDAAVALSRRFEAALTDVRRETASLPRRQVLPLIWRDPWMTVSPDTYVARMLDLVRWHVVTEAAVPRYPAVDLVRAVRAGVDLVLLTTEPYPFAASDAENLRTELELPKNRVLVIDGQAIGWYGSRALAGMACLARLARSVD